MLRAFMQWQQFSTLSKGRKALHTIARKHREIIYSKLCYSLHSGNFDLKKRKKTRKYSHNFQRNNRNKQSSIPLRRGASVFHTNRNNLHPLFVGAFPNFEKRLLASPCLSVSPPIWKNSAPSEWTFMKFDIRGPFFSKICRENSS